MVELHSSDAFMYVAVSLDDNGVTREGGVEPVQVNQRSSEVEGNAVVREVRVEPVEANQRDGVVEGNDVGRDGRVEQRHEEVSRTTHDVEGDLEEMYKILESKQTIVHHLAFADQCIEHSIYPLGLKAFVPCVAHKADNNLRKQWKAILHNTSLELLALCRTHFVKLLNKNGDSLNEIEKRVEGYKEEDDRTKWEEKKIMMEKEMKEREREMKEGRSKKNQTCNKNSQGR